MNEWTEVQVKAYTAVVNAKQQYEEKRTVGGVEPATITMHPQNIEEMIRDLPHTQLEIGYKEVLIDGLKVIENDECQP